MRVVEDVSDRLVIRGASPLFRPFFFGGLGLLALGVCCLLAGPIAGRSSIGPPGAADGATSLAGLGAFLATFGFFVALVPLAGRFPYRREIIVDRAAGTLVRRDRTLVRLRQETYPADEVQGIDVVELRQVERRSLLQPLPAAGIG